MSAINCPVCMKVRSVETISTSDGWINAPCWNCGDPGWTQPYGEEDPLVGRVGSENKQTLIEKIEVLLSKTERDNYGRELIDVDTLRDIIMIEKEKLDDGFDLWIDPSKE